MSADPAEVTMSFWEHLEELRRRIVYAALAFVAGAIVAWVFKEKLLLIITQPYIEAWKTGSLDGSPALHFPAPASLFLAYVKLTIIAGAILALPVILYQVWAFVAPGLYSHERRYAVPFVFSSCLLFVGGATFGLKVAFPLAFNFFLGMTGTIEGSLEVRPTVMVGDYLEFVSYMLLAFGLAFELPVFIFFLSVVGLVDYKQLFQFSRYFVVIAFVAAAVFTPPDIMSQFLLAIPLIILYGVSIGVAYVFGRRPKKPDQGAGPS